MGEQVYPTEPGWWWALVDDSQAIVEVEQTSDGWLWFEHQGAPHAVSDQPLGFGRWLAPVASPEAVAKLRAIASGLAGWLEAEEKLAGPEAGDGYDAWDRATDVLAATTGCHWEELNDALRAAACAP